MTDEMHLAERLLDMVGPRAEAEVRVTGGNLALTRFANSFIHQNVAEESVTVRLRVAVEDRVATATTNRSDDASLREFVDDALDVAQLQPVDPEWPGLAPPAATPVVDHNDPATAAASPDDRAAVVREFVDAGSGGGAAGYCETSGSEVAFVNSTGQHAAGRSSAAVLDGIHETDTSSGSAHAASSRLADIDAAAVGEVAAGRARDSMDPSDLEPGAYEVVLAPECVATLAVFLSVYGFNAKMHQEGQSFADVGTTQFDEHLSIWDDATDQRALGVPFDLEGTPRSHVDFVRDGVVVGLAHDRRTAARVGGSSTGHHAAGSDSWGPLATNLFIESGGRTVAELISGVERGLYVATFNYCRVLDPKSLVVTGLTRNGTFLIEAGEITGAVSNLRFTQSFVEALGPGRVAGIGLDARFADSEFGPGFAYVPSIRLASWGFTGGASG